MPLICPPPTGQTGIAANALASTPYDVATGGTDFLDTYEETNTLYWSTNNNSVGNSAKSYIPEMPWNDSCASNILFSYFGYPSGLTFCNSSLGANFLDIGAGSGAPSLGVLQAFLADRDRRHAERWQT